MALSASADNYWQAAAAGLSLSQADWAVQYVSVWRVGSAGLSLPSLREGVRRRHLSEMLERKCGKYEEEVGLGAWLDKRERILRHLAGLADRLLGQVKELVGEEQPELLEGRGIDWEERLDKEMLQELYGTHDLARLTRDYFPEDEPVAEEPAEYQVRATVGASEAPHMEESGNPELQRKGTIDDPYERQAFSAAKYAYPADRDAAVFLPLRLALDLLDIMARWQELQKVQAQLRAVSARESR